MNTLVPGHSYEGAKLDDLLYLSHFASYDALDGVFGMPSTSASASANANANANLHANLGGRVSFSCHGNGDGDVKWTSGCIFSWLYSYLYLSLYSCSCSYSYSAYPNHCMHSGLLMLQQWHNLL